MPLSHPYIIYGTIKQNGNLQANVDVTVKNQTTNEQHTVQTDSEGKYIVTITRTDWFPSGASEGDTIAITFSTTTKTVTVDTANHPWGIKVNFNTLLKTETLSFQDLLSKLLHKALQETLNVSDSKKIKPSKIQTETLNLQESFIKTWTIYKVLTTVLSLQDSRTVKPSLLTTETLNLSDAVVKALYKQLQNNLTLQDVFTKTWSKYLTQMETLQLQEVFSKTWSKYLAQTETLQFQDGFSKTIQKTHTETLSLNDPIIRELFVALIKKTLTENLSLGDSAKKKTWKIQSETLLLSDSFNRVWSLARILTDILTLQDFYVKTRTLRKTLQDTLTLNDIILRSIISGLIKKELMETLQFSDQQPTFSLTKILTDMLTFQDRFNRTWFLARTLTDTLVLNDSVSSSMGVPFYGVLTLYEILADLDLYFLRQILNVEEK